MLHATQYWLNFTGDDIDVYDVDDDYDRKVWKGSTGEYVIIRHWLTSKNFEKTSTFLGSTQSPNPSGKNLIT
jgi:hypothetical protein